MDTLNLFNRSCPLEWKSSLSTVHGRPWGLSSLLGSVSIQAVHCFLYNSSFMQSPLYLSPEGIFLYISQCYSFYLQSWQVRVVTLYNYCIYTITAAISNLLQIIHYAALCEMWISHMYACYGASGIGKPTKRDDLWKHHYQRLSYLAGYPILHSRFTYRWCTDG